MVQTSDEQSRETHVETRGGINYYHTNEEQKHKGWHWCHDKQGYFRYSDWNLTKEEIGEKYGLNS